MADSTTRTLRAERSAASWQCQRAAAGSLTTAALHLSCGFAALQVSNLRAARLFEACRSMRTVCRQECRRYGRLESLRYASGQVSIQSLRSGPYRSSIGRLCRASGGARQGWTVTNGINPPVS